MNLLLSIFAFASVLLRGATLVLQSLVIGGAVFETLTLRALGSSFAADLETASRSARRLIFLSALALALTQTIYLFVNSAVLMGTADLHFGEVIGANFFLAGCLTFAGALALAFLSAKGGLSLSPAPMLLAAAVILAGSVMTNHAAARVDHRVWLIVLTAIHETATAVWIGGLPYLILALRRVRDDHAAEVLNLRFSRTALVGVGFLGASGILMSFSYVGSWAALYGTAYGVMLFAKMFLLGTLLVLGGLNFFMLRRIDHAEAMPRLRRFVECEIGIGFTVVLAAASLTSQPPAADLTTDRASASEILERFTPTWPRLKSPDVKELSEPTLQVLRRAAKAGAPTGLQSYIPGTTTTHPNTPSDIAWSEYNHNWVGLLIILFGGLALLSRTGKLPWARHWPLLFLGLAAFIFLRADPENWPLGPNGFWESFTNSEVLQHRLAVVMVICFGIFEWRVQTNRARSQWASLVFPMVCATGGALLLTHSHALGNIKDELLAEISHTWLALFAVLAGWARWLELRLQGNDRRIPGWIWPICFILIGTVLVTYREA
ncbi:MAG TPA: CopD family protein [Terriglobales bacterium]|nr:CopD family protein [Terriglobales bacterium]